MLSIILRHKGHNVTSADNDLQAVNLVQGRPFDLIMMDIKMPVMSGAEACLQTRQIRPRAAVVMMRNSRQLDRAAKRRFGYQSAQALLAAFPTSGSKA